jgi:hypothetical protein
LSATPSLAASDAVERIAAAAILRGDLAVFAGLRDGVPLSGIFAVRLLCRAWTPRMTTAATVNFERNDITSQPFGDP